MGKFDLDKLKVESFVTSLNSSDKQTVAGGDATDMEHCASHNCSQVGCNMTDDFENCGGENQSHANSCVHACHTEILDDHCRTPVYPC